MHHSQRPGSFKCFTHWTE